MRKNKERITGKMNTTLDLDVMLERLPYDVIWYIYKEFIQVEQLYILFQQRLHSRTSLQLNASELRPLLPQILANPMAVRYFSKQMVILPDFHFFQHIYEKTRIQNEKNFRQMHNGTSFCTALLMYLHH